MNYFFLGTLLLLSNHVVAYEGKDIYEFFVDIRTDSIQFDFNGNPQHFGTSLRHPKPLVQYEFFLRNETVRKEIALVSSQERDLDQLLKRVDEVKRDFLLSYQPDNHEKLKESFANHFNTFNEQLDSILLPHQRETLAQLVLRAQIRSVGIVQLILYDSELFGESFGSDAERLIVEGAAAAAKHFDQKLQEITQRFYDTIFETLTSDQRRQVDRLGLPKYLNDFVLAEVEYWADETGESEQVEEVAETLDILVQPLKYRVELVWVQALGNWKRSNVKNSDVKALSLLLHLLTIYQEQMNTDFVDFQTERLAELKMSFSLRLDKLSREYSEALDAGTDPKVAANSLRTQQAEVFQTSFPKSNQTFLLVRRKYRSKHFLQI